LTPNFQVEILGFDTHTVPRPPARASHKMRRPALRENCAYDFFLFWRTLAEQLSSDRARS